MSISANWSYPTAIRLGAGRIQELAEACAAAGIRRPLLVTDRGLAGLPMTAAVRELLTAAGVEHGFFSKVDPNPTDTNLAEGVEVLIDGAYDGVIAFGGGSALDLGKLIAFQAHQRRPVWDFEDIGDWWTRADAAAILPNIAVPTTAGTGSEVGRAGVLTDSKSHVKKIIFHPKILPSVVICDPELTLGMPMPITVGTGMDAFIHCLEAYSSPFYHPMSQGIALEGMRLALNALPKIFDRPEDMDARTDMMSAAAMGAVAFQKGLGAMHALSHPVGAVYNTHHGTTNAVVMPAVLRFNRHAIEDRIAAAAAYIGIAGGFDGFYSHLVDLRARLGVPDKLRELGVGDDRIDELAAMAVADPSAGGNPVALTVDAAGALYRECI